MIRKKITSRASNYSQWYLDIVETAQLAQNSVVRECMTICPNGYAIWENIHDILDKKIKNTGHQNLYFPIFIPKSLLSKESQHVKGFAKECAVVTHYRLVENESGNGVMVNKNAKLEDELIIRPTSETIMYETFKNWVSSFRDLPLLFNQWNNVVRWEKRTRPFIRTSEFLWQEGHTAHITELEAQGEIFKMLEIYKELIEQVLAIPVVTGTKSESEKFAGAKSTYTLEALMQDGKALQSGTLHNLGQNFSKAFDIKFTNKQGKLDYVWQTSWVVSTRLIGALIMTHGDDKGLVLPPHIAPIQIIIIPIYKEENKNEVLDYCNKLTYLMGVSDLRVECDVREHESPGSKFNRWEQRGIPIRIEIGMSEIERKQVSINRRDTGEKSFENMENIVQTIKILLEDVQTNLFNQASTRLHENTSEVINYSEFKNTFLTKKGFVKAFWCEDLKCEEMIKKETKATTRCLPIDSKKLIGKCIYCGYQCVHKWIFAQSY